MHAVTKRCHHMAVAGPRCMRHIVTSPPDIIIFLLNQTTPARLTTGCTDSEKLAKHKVYKERPSVKKCDC